MRTGSRFPTNPYSGPTPQSALDQAKTYADGLVVGLFDDRGNYDASGNTFPASGGSGAAGAIMKGDIWRISVAGSLGGVYVNAGDWVRALADTPGQTAANWAINKDKTNTTTLAALPAASAASGAEFFVTDVGVNGSYWRSNGSEWFPLNPTTIFTATDSYGRAPSGTISTGSSGNITFGTAASRAYTEGLYVYLPSIATTPAITAGWYWCVMSNTTTGTLYASKGGAAINFTGGASYTGVTAAIDVPQATVKGTVMGNYRRINISGNISVTSNANSKATGIKWGSTSYGAASFASVAGHCFTCDIRNKGTSVQSITPQINGGGSSGTPAYATADTTSDVTFGPSLSNAVSTATDWWIIDSWQAVLYPR